MRPDPHHSASTGPELSAQEAPYLSVVATARNDDHGGNLLGRMQIFVDAWINQANRHQLSSELIIVEWNPPEQRPRLAEALRWPADTGVCAVRIIEVPPEIHARYRHAAALPLYQMIAKNAGIRRARGEFVLATNIDIVFSDELVRFLASKPLVKGRMYRIDRHDVMSDVPVDGTLDEQISYCRTHVIRHCAREGIFRLSPEGLRQTEVEDIAPQDSGIHFDTGWFPAERYGPERCCRWIEKRAQLFLQVPKGGALLELEVEPGPGVFPGPGRLQVLDGSGSNVAEWTIAGHATLRLLVPEAPDGGMQQLQLYVPDGGRPLLHDPRILDFRFVRIDWAEPWPALPATPQPAALRAARAALKRYLTSRRKTQRLASWVPDDEAKAVQLLALRGDDIFGPGVECCGAGWHELEHFHRDKLRWISNAAALIVRTKEQSTLALLVEPGPGVDYHPFELLVRRGDGEVVAKAPIDGFTYVELPLSLPPGVSVLFLDVEGGGKSTGTTDTRTLNFRIYACACKTVSEVGGDELSGTWTAVTARTGHPVIDCFYEVKKHGPTIAGIGRPVSLHCNACGDFTLMAREDWFEVRGYAELDQFSMHLDSILCYVAHHAGLEEEILAEPMRIYHIEHGSGSGWTPEGESEMYMRIARKGIPTISFDQLVGFIAQMRVLHAPVIFNMDDWGLEAFALAETAPQSQGQHPE